MSRFYYTPEMIAFIDQAYQKAGVADVTEAFNGKFGTDKTPKQIKAAISNYGIKCGRTTGEINKGQLKSFTREQAEFIVEKYKELTIKELKIAFNEKFGTDKTYSQIRCFTRNHGVRSGRTGYFEKGQRSWNSGMKGWTAGGRSAETRFKKGRESKNIRPVGSERICSKDGYVLIKVAMPNKWRLKHIVEWEKHNGPVPTNHRIWFKDNVRTNWQIENLMLITRAQGAVINKNGHGTVDADLKQSAICMADISMKKRELTSGR